MSKRIRVTSKRQPRVRSTGPTQQRVDPAVVGAAIGSDEHYRAMGRRAVELEKLYGPMPSIGVHPRRDAWSFDSTVREVMANPVARVAAAENALRRQISSTILAACAEQGVSPAELKRRMGEAASAGQLRKLLHEEVGGYLALGTICRAADALGLVVEVRVGKR